MNTAIMSLTLALLVPGVSIAATVHFQSGTQRVSLLELYTSEGCSSCPPAEAWLNRLKDSPNLWKDFVPVEFHVDYWNSIGWKDSWSAPEYSERQSNYARKWNAENVYTPCFILNGEEWHGWLFRRGIPNSAGMVAGVLSISSSGSNLWTAIFIPAKPTNTDYDIHAVLMAAGLGSDVKAGENSGRHLRHEFVALNLVQTKMVTSQGVARARFILATPRSSVGNVRAISVWVTRAGELEPLQTVGGWLEPPERAN
jgi:hypothetical protein